ncbi:MAG: divalent metal cation transporter, partial [Myxococcota bacterium]
MQSNLFKALGPGLIFAGAAVGVSHLVQATRAGASFGFGLVGLIVLANVVKYPTFRFGPYYAAATGTSLLEGYRRQGPWALGLFSVLTIATMFTVQAAVAVVTAALAIATYKVFAGPASADPSLWAVTAALLLLCAALLSIGRYRWLDRITKALIGVLTISTMLATALALSKADWGSMSFWPSPGVWANKDAVFFMAALVGWMPSAFDTAVWVSLYTLARRDDTGYLPTLRESMIDFNIGYIGTALLALCFVTLGAALMHGKGETFANSAPAFAGQIIGLYTRSLGPWAGSVVSIAAMSTMFSTTLTVVDGFPRVINRLLLCYRQPETPDMPALSHGRSYWFALTIVGIGSLIIVALIPANGFRILIDLATTLSFLASPALALLNHRAVTSDAIAAQHRPGRGILTLSW